MHVPARWRDGVRRWAATPAIRLFAVSFVILFVWWLAFYPGTVSPDSVSYTLQITRGPWSTDFSVFYQALLWLSFAITGGIALLTFAQVVASAAAMTYAATGMLALGARLRWVVVAVVGVSLLPTLGAFAPYLSKDVAFSAAEVFAFGVLARIVALRRIDAAARPPIWTWVRLGIGYLLMCLFRDNAALMVIVGAALLIVALRGLRRQVAITAGSAVAAWAILTFGIYPAAGVHSASSSLVLGTAYADIAAAYQRAPSTFKPADLDLMALEAPLTVWSDRTDCYSSDTLDIRPPWDRKAAAAHSHQLFRLWLRVLRRTPQHVIDARICRGAIAWLPVPSNAHPSSLLPAGESRTLFGRADALPPSRAHALRPEPIDSTLRGAALFVERASFARNLQFILYRGATWAYLSYLAVFLYLRRRSLSWRIGLSLVSVTVANQFVVFIDNPNQLTRYMLPCLYIGLALVTLLTRPPPTSVHDRAVGSGSV